MTALLSLARLESAPEENRGLGSLLGLSLVAHVAIFLLATSMQWSPELRPLSSQEVTLVSLHAAPPRAAAPKAVAPVTPPQPQKEAPPASMRTIETPPAPLKSAPATESVPPPPAPPAPVRQSTFKDLLGQDFPAPPPKSAETVPKPDGLMRELMRGMELPPEAPKLGEEIPASTSPSKSAKSFESSVKNLSVPNAPKLAAPAPPLTLAPAPTTKPVTLPPAPSLKSLMTEELKNPAPTPPAVTAKAPAVDLQKPAMEIRSQSAAPGQSRYLALVQHRISQFWTPIDVQTSSQSLRVRIKFRLTSTGIVSNVAVEQSSGVYYYDQAGQRAVLSAVPLPPFPPDLKEAWLDVHISFTVGEGAG